MHSRTKGDYAALDLAFASYSRSDSASQQDYYWQLSHTESKQHCTVLQSCAPAPPPITSLCNHNLDSHALLSHPDARLSRPASTGLPAATGRAESPRLHRERGAGGE
jgi:hypothetical protein